MLGRLELDNSIGNVLTIGDKLTGNVLTVREVLRNLMRQELHILVGLRVSSSRYTAS